MDRWFIDEWFMDKWLVEKCFMGNGAGTRYA